MQVLFKRLLGIAATVLLVACSQQPEDKEPVVPVDGDFVLRAEQHLNDGALEAAGIELKNALQVNSADGHARYLLGRVLLELGAAADAVKELSRADELGASEDLTIPLLAQAYLALNKHQEVFNLPTQRIDDPDPLASTLATQALAQIEVGQYEAAAELLNRASALAPELPDVLVAKGRYLAATGLHDLARRELDRVLGSNPDYAPAWAALGDLEQVSGNLEAAETAYEKAAENRRNNFSDRLKLAKTRIDLGEHEAAKAELSKLLQLFPLHPGVNYAQGLNEFYLGHDAEARDALQIALKTQNYIHDTLFYLAVANWNLGSRELAQEYAQKFMAEEPRSIRGRKLMASIEMANESYFSAENMIRPVVGARPDDAVALNLLIAALTNQERFEEALPFMAQRVELAPESTPYRLALASALSRAGQPLQSVEQIESALQLDPTDSKANAALVLHYLNRSAIAPAKAAAEHWVQSSPDELAALNLFGRLSLMSGEETTAKGAFERAVEIAPDDPSAIYALAAMSITDKDYATARAYYQSLLEKDINSLPTQMRLAQLDAVENKHAQMVRRLEGMISRYPHQLQPRLLLARYYLSSGEPEKVARLVLLNLSGQQMEHPEVLELLGLSQLFLEQYGLAKSTLKKLTEVQPDSAQAHFLLAKAWSGLGNEFFLREELEKTVELAPRHFGVRLALTTLLLKDKQVDRAEEHLSILSQLSPENPDVLRLTALGARLQGDQERALTLLEDLFRKTLSTTSMLELASHKWALGERDAVFALEEQWLEEHPEDLVASLALAEAYNRAGREEQAIGQYLRILELDPQNVAALNELAWLLRDQQPSVSLEYARQANRLAPGTAHVLDTLAVAQMKNGDLVRAKVNIDNALGREPNNPAIRYHKAVIDLESGKRTEARMVLDSLLLEEDVQFSEKTAAIALLERLKAERQAKQALSN